MEALEALEVLVLLVVVAEQDRPAGPHLAPFPGAAAVLGGADFQVETPDLRGAPET